MSHCKRAFPGAWLWLAALLCLVAGGCTTPIRLGPDGLSFQEQPPEVKMTLVSSQENTLFEIRPVGATDWMRVGKAKILDTQVGRQGRYEVRATPDGYQPKIITLAEPVMELRFTFEISERLPGEPGPRVVTDPPVRPADPGDGRTYAVCIGLSEYQDSDFARLAFGSQDAADVAALLQRQPKASADTLRLLTDAKATKANVEDALEGFLSRAGTSDTILVYWSGHAFPEPGNPDKVFFACYDTSLNKPHTGLRMDKVRDALAEKKARYTVVLADTCHAGKLITRDIKVVRKEIGVAGGMAFFLAAEKDRKAVEAANWPNGAFTHVLLGALRGQADGYQGAGAKDGVVTLGELRSYIQSEMPKLTQEKLGTALHPSISVTAGDEAINRLRLTVTNTGQ